MIDNKILELMNREIDKANTEKESSELNEYLDKNPEAKQHFLELVKMNMLLAKIPDMDPPADMKMNIMNSIDLNKYAKKAKQPNFFQSLAEFFTVRPKLRLVTTFAIGAAFGLALFAVSDKYIGADFPLDQSHLSGTIMIEKELAEFVVIGSKPIETNYFNGTFELKRSGTDLLADIVLNSKVPAKITINIDNNHTVFKGFNQLAYTYSGVNITDTDINWEHFGNNRFLINLEDITTSESVVRLSISSDQANFEASIPTRVASN
jgi:hypothetical protein